MREHFKARCPQLLRPLTLQNGFEEMAAYMTQLYLTAVQSEVVHVQEDAWSVLFSIPAPHPQISFPSTLR